MFSESGILKISEKPGRVAAVLLATLLFGSLSFWCKFPTLYEWDSVNYVTATRSFNLFLIQPHPPGYIGFVMLLKGFISLFNSDFYGFYILVLLSYLIYALFSTLLFKELTRTYFNPAVYLLFLSIPMVFFHSTVTTIYLTEGAMVLLMVYILLKVFRKKLHPLFVFAILLAAPIKTNIPIVLLPLAVYVLWKRYEKWGFRIVVVFLLILAMVGGQLGLQKLVFWVSRAPDSFDRLISGYIIHDNILSAYFGGLKNLLLTILKNFKNVFLALLAQVFAFFLIMAPGSGKIGFFRNLTRENRNFLLLWILPHLSFVLFFYFPKNGYLLEILTGILILLMGCFPPSSLEIRMKWVWIVNLIIFFIPINIDYLNAKIRVSGASKTVKEYMLTQAVRVFENTNSHLKSVQKVNNFYFSAIPGIAPAEKKLFILENSVADQRIISYYLKNFTFLIVQKEQRHFIVSFFQGGRTRVDLVEKKSSGLKLDGYGQYYLISSKPDSKHKNLREIRNTIYRIDGETIDIGGLHLELRGHSAEK